MMGYFNPLNFLTFPFKSFLHLLFGRQLERLDLLLKIRLRALQLSTINQLQNRG